MAAGSKFKSNVQSFEDVSKALAQIDKFLGTLSTLINKIDWNKLFRDYNSGGPAEAPPPPPPKWPPQ
jgi:hypothetical protein